MKAEEDLRLLRSLFKSFYEENGELVETPSAMERREFGFLMMGKRVMVRHLSFHDGDALLRFIRDNVPSDCYRSAAYYDIPDAADMPSKGWLGADLVFDIDADHIPSPCKDKHDRWRCLDCGMEGRGSAPESCPNCGLKKIEERSWFCSECLEAAKRETIKLLGFLTSDFGISDKEISVYFSGHRGYHVHVEDEGLRSLDQDARREIVDYVTGLGLNPSAHGLLNVADERSFSRLMEYSSWAERLMRAGYELVLKCDVEGLTRVGLPKRKASLLVEHRDEILENWWRGGFVKPVGGLGERSWETILLQAARKEAALVDTVVTTDIHRLIRLEGSIHGKTGFRKVRVLGDLEEFDPLKDAVAFKKGELTVYVEEAPEFRVGASTYGPFKESRVELPTAAAVLLICKGLARMV